MPYGEKDGQLLVGEAAHAPLNSISMPIVVFEWFLVGGTDTGTSTGWPRERGRERQRQVSFYRQCVHAHLRVFIPTCLLISTGEYM